MDISKLRSRITIQHSEVVTDAIGDHTNAWVDYWSCAAYANLASGKEYGAAGQTLGSDTLVFEVRWCEWLRELGSTKYRILFGGNIYNITCAEVTTWLVTGFPSTSSPARSWPSLRNMCLWPRTMSKRPSLS